MNTAVVSRVITGDKLIVRVIKIEFTVNNFKFVSSSLFENFFPLKLFHENLIIKKLTYGKIFFKSKNF